jgi:pimeloyl-ACP methyl ester carboxylesterase
MVLVPEEFLVRLEQMIGAGQREEAVSTFMLNTAGVTPKELEVLRANPAWPGRAAAAHTIPRELRAVNNYAPDLERVSAIGVPVLMIVGEQTEPLRRGMWEQVAGLFKDARVGVLPGQRHAAHQTAPGSLANALRDFLSIDSRGARSGR